MNVFDNFSGWIASIENRLLSAGYEEARFGSLMPYHGRDEFELRFRVREAWEGSIYESDPLIWTINTDGVVTSEPKIFSREVRELRQVLRSATKIERMVDNSELCSSFAKSFVEGIKPRLDEARRLLEAPDAE